MESVIKKGLQIYHKSCDLYIDIYRYIYNDIHSCPDLNASCPDISSPCKTSGLETS